LIHIAGLQEVILHKGLQCVLLSDERRSGNGPGFGSGRKAVDIIVSGMAYISVQLNSTEAVQRVLRDEKPSETLSKEKRKRSV